MPNCRLHRVLSAAALLLLSATAHAALTVYTTEASFLAAVSAPGTDTFDDLVVADEGSFESPVDRSAGDYRYSASATTAGGANSMFFAAGSTADPWLSTFLPDDRISFYAFSDGISAIGGRFFASDFDGVPLVGESLVLMASDADGSVSVTLLTASDTSFLGFVSTGPLLSLLVSTVQSAAFPYPTVNNLVLASPVDDVATGSLLLAGLAALALRARRRTG